MAYSYADYQTTREERRAFQPFYPDMRDIHNDDEYAECVREANDEYVAAFAPREA